MYRTTRITKTIAPITALALMLFVSACKPGKHQLPIKGPIKLAGNDTIYHQIPSFSFINQNRDTITEAFVEGKVYVADFFFVSCPTICQEMARNMKTVYEKFKDHENFAILSHTIAPRQDTPARLNAYAEKLNVKAPTWQFLTGNAKEIYRIGEKWYMTTAREEDNEMGDYLHNGSFILVDQHRRIRGVYDGTKADQVAMLIADLPILLNRK